MSFLAFLFGGLVGFVAGFLLRDRLGDAGLRLKRLIWDDQAEG